MMCNCPVCCTYKAYFGKHRIDGYPTTQAIKPCKHACTTSKKCKQSEFHSFSDRRCCASDEVRMAGAVHHHIHNNLNASRYYRFIGESLSSLKYPCNISEQRQVTRCGKSQYREEFYRDLENFYRKLNSWFK
ncbi:hypothetical protein L798_10131 [Zootermopsis nevadensis]|uniref:Uncharacterized protein n=1 Tax=Zootermopsis nevadensis TaxID=136037 RepID=A0A067R0C5_ZOONE|nr:hypothetical protein L798_10131 [Zootermopsis nevadensis]